MQRTIAEIARILHGDVIGDEDLLIHDVNSIEAAGAGEITFAEDAKSLTAALKTPAAAVIVSSDVHKLAGKTGIRVSHPKLAFVLALDLFHPAQALPGGVHATAVLGERVQLGQRVTIRAHAVIGDDVSLGGDTVIESGVHIGNGVSIGAQSLIGPNVVVYRHSMIGERVRIHAGSVIGGDGFGYIFHDGRHVKVPQVGNVIIEDDVEIGCNVCVDRATIGSTIIQRGTKIDNLVQIAHNNRVGKHVIIAGMSGMSGSVTVGDYAVLGGRASVTDHVTIGAGAQVGLCSVVTKSVPAKSVVWGFPARPIRDAKHQLAALARLPKILARLVSLEHKQPPADDR